MRALKRQLRKKITTSAPIPQKPENVARIRKDEINARELQIEVARIEAKVEAASSGDAASPAVKDRALAKRIERLKSKVED